MDISANSVHRYREGGRRTCTEVKRIEGASVWSPWLRQLNQHWAEPPPGVSAHDFTRQWYHTGDPTLPTSCSPFVSSEPSALLSYTDIIMMLLLLQLEIGIFSWYLLSFVIFLQTVNKPVIGWLTVLIHLCNCVSLLPFKKNYLFLSVCWHQKANLALGYQQSQASLHTHFPFLSPFFLLLLPPLFSLFFNHDMHSVVLSLGFLHVQLMWEWLFDSDWMKHVK